VNVGLSRLSGAEVTGAGANGSGGGGEQAERHNRRAVKQYAKVRMILAEEQGFPKKSPWSSCLRGWRIGPKKCRRALLAPRPPHERIQVRGAPTPYLLSESPSLSLFCCGENPEPLALPAGLFLLPALESGMAELLGVRVLLPAPLPCKLSIVCSSS
jgi:hypothetical protein